MTTKLQQQQQVISATLAQFDRVQIERDNRLREDFSNVARRTQSLQLVQTVRTCQICKGPCVAPCCKGRSVVAPCLQLGPPLSRNASVGQRPLPGPAPERKQMYAIPPFRGQARLNSIVEEPLARQVIVEEPQEPTGCNDNTSEAEDVYFEVDAKYLELNNNNEVFYVKRRKIKVFPTNQSAI